MSSFTTPLDFENLDDGVSFRLLTPFTYHVGELGSEEEITVPTGFVTDLASIPTVLWNLFPKLGRYNKAAVIHDYLYVIGGRYPHAQAPDGTWTYRIYTKVSVDGIFRDAMTVLGVTNPRRWLMWKAVALFGRGAFDKV